MGSARRMLAGAEMFCPADAGSREGLRRSAGYAWMDRGAEQEQESKNPGGAAGYAYV